MVTVRGYRLEGPVSLEQVWVATKSQVALRTLGTQLGRGVHSGSLE